VRLSSRLLGNTKIQSVANGAIKVVPVYDAPILPLCLQARPNRRSEMRTSLKAS
jgi:hypothetical protein